MCLCVCVCETMERVDSSCLCLDAIAYKLLNSGGNNKDTYHFSYKNPVLKGIPRKVKCCDSSKTSFILPLCHLVQVGLSP